MKLLCIACERLAWLRALVARLARLQGGATLGAVTARIVAHVASVLAFMLPLKVVLLVGSDRVPRYFQSLVAADDRDLWIAGLAAATVGFYLLSVAAASVSDRWVASLAQRVRESAGQVPLRGDDDERTQRHVDRIVGVTAKLAFALLAVLAGLVLYPALFAFLVGVLALEALAVGFAVGAPQARGWRGRLARSAQESVRSLLAGLQAVAFLSVFAFLVVSFLVGAGVNILVAIASLILSRQLLRAANQAVHGLLSLGRAEAEISALLLESAQFEPSPRRVETELRVHCGPEQRLRRVRELAAQAGEPRLAKVVRSDWVDGASDATAAFDLFLADGQAPAFRDQVFGPRAARGLVHEEYLLRWFSAEQLRAVPRLVAYEAGNLRGRVQRREGLRATGGKQARSARHKLVAHLWALEVPTALRKAYVRVRPLLAQRCDEGLLASLALPTEDADAAQALEQLRARLPALRDRVAALPLAPLNGRLAHGNLLLDDRDAPWLADWRSWTLEPVGSGADLEPQSLQRCVAEAARLRANGRLDSGTPAADLVTAALLLDVERRVAREQRALALVRAGWVLPLLDLDDEDLEAALRDYDALPDDRDDLADETSDATELESDDLDAEAAAGEAAWVSW